jgi:hypothetical protein
LAPALRPFQRGDAEVAEANALTRTARDGRIDDRLEDEKPPGYGTTLKIAKPHTV